MGKKYQLKNSEFHLLPQEISRLLEAADNLRDKVLLAILAYTGMRRAEARNLERQDISLNRREIHVRLGKGNKERIVFIPDPLSKLLSEYVSKLKAGPLFPGRSGKALSLRSINLIAARVGRKAHIENPNPRYSNITPHLLRHSLARNWKRAGGSLESLQKVLGHESLRTTMDLYGTESLPETKQNYLRLSKHLVSPNTEDTTL